MLNRQLRKARTEKKKNAVLNIFTSFFFFAEEVFMSICKVKNESKTSTKLSIAVIAIIAVDMSIENLN